MTPSREKPARDLLAFYAEAGVDAVLGEQPVDRFADETSVATRALPNPFLPTSTPALPGNRNAGGSPASALAPPDQAVMAAREAAKSAKSLDELRAILDKFDGCALKATATQLVFADGNPQAKVMFVGEAPGRDEDIAGLPFFGRSGKLLDRMLAAIGLDRSKVYIANVVPWRPPGNRTPTPQETAVCRPFLERQIELCDPDVLVCLGGAAAKELMATAEGILRLRGQWRDYDLGPRKIRIMATLHPAYLLRQPLQKRLAWRDFLSIRAAL